MKQSISIIALTILITIGCAKVPISGRRQMNLLPSSQMTSLSADAYGDFLNQNAPLPASNPDAQLVRKVGERISQSVDKYMRDNGMKKEVENYDWTFNTIQDPTINAWCMPGGRVVFYTGILPICQGEAGIAVVMGHEIAHAVARHGNERMSQGLLIQGAGMTLDVLTAEKPDLTRNLLLQSFGIGTALGSLAYSRSHETEADQLGLVFMAMAGYDPRAAPAFWKRMAAQSQGNKPPEFLSTHPADDTRAEDLESFMPEALKYYKP